MWGAGPPLPCGCNLVVPQGLIVYGGGGPRGVNLRWVFSFVRNDNSNSLTKLAQRDTKIALLTENIFSFFSEVIWTLVQNPVHERFWGSRFFDFFNFRFPKMGSPRSGLVRTSVATFDRCQTI